MRFRYDPAYRATLGQAHEGRLGTTDVSFPREMTSLESWVRRRLAEPNESGA